MTTFDKAPKEAEDILQELLSTCEEFEPLVECGLTVQLSWATGSERKDGTRNPALSHGGYPATALAKRISLEDRTHGAKDAKITVDSIWWDSATDEQKRALIHHELYHFEPKCDDTGAVIMDNVNRPEIKLRKHSVQFGWFYATAKRFGKASQEAIQFKSICDEAGQLLMPSLLEDYAALKNAAPDDETATAVDFAANARKLANAVSSSRAVAAQ